MGTTACFIPINRLAGDRQVGGRKSIAQEIEPSRDPSNDHLARVTVLREFGGKSIVETLLGRD